MKKKQNKREKETPQIPGLVWYVQSRYQSNIGTNSQSRVGKKAIHPTSRIEMLLQLEITKGCATLWPCHLQ
jgi:hypothetical protein